MDRGNGGARQKTLFLGGSARGEFIRPKRRRSNKTLLFLFVALTLGRTVAKSGIRSNLTGSRDLQWFLRTTFLQNLGSLRREKPLKRHEASSWAPQPWR
jgi:hypothetical protein